MSRSVADASLKWDNASRVRELQAPIDRVAFSARLDARMKELGVTAADLKRSHGLPTSSTSRWLTGQGVPSSEQIYPLSDALRISARWLLYGGARGAPSVIDAADVEWAMIPTLNLLAFTPEGRPEPIDIIPVRRPYLTMVDAPVASLFLTTLPMAVGEVIRAGETLLCRDAEPDLLDGRLYILVREGNPLVRRVAVDRSGYTLISLEPMVPPLKLDRGDPTHPDEQLVPIARILGRFGLQAI